MAILPANNIISPGWIPIERFDERSDLVNVAAGAGVAGVAPQIVLTKEIPPAARALLLEMNLRLPDGAGYDQIYFQLTRNGHSISPWDFISATQVELIPTIDIGAEFEGGLLELLAWNISGTSWPGASLNAAAIRVTASIRGQLLKKT